jgi:DNA replication protein DnaC
MATGSSYRPAGKLFRDLQQAQADGSLNRHLPMLTKVDVLVVDDFAMNPLDEMVSPRYWHSAPCHTPR